MPDHEPVSAMAHSERLELLAGNKDPLPDAVAAVGAERRWWGSDLRWARTFGRFDPGKVPFCTLVYETAGDPQHLCLAELFLAAHPDSDARAAWLPLAPLGVLRLTPFPWDPSLPGLPSVVCGRRGVRVLRYRPRKRCTLSVTDGPSSPQRIVKIFNDGRGRSLHEESGALWQAASRGELDVEVARPIRWDAATRGVWQSAVAGVPVVEKLFSGEGEALAERMGRCCASIAVSGLRPGARLDGASQLARTRRYAGELAQRNPQLERSLEAFLAGLATANQRPGPRPLRPIHGAPHAHQWLDCGERLGLVDFDRFSLGDPELDVATFVTEMDFESREKVPVDRLNRIFIDAYETVAGPLDHGLLQVYRAHKRLAKALKAARAVRPDGRERAARTLLYAHEALREAGE